MAGSPGEPLLAERPLDEPGPFRKPPLVGYQIGAIDRREEAGECGIIEPPGETWEVEPAIVGQFDRNPGHALIRPQAVGQLGDDRLDRPLHPWIKDVVMRATWQLPRSSIAPHTHDPGGRLASPFGFQ